MEQDYALSPHSTGFGSVVRTAGIAGISTLVGQGAGYLTVLLLALSLGTGGMGLFSLAITVVSVASLVGRLGLGITVLRFAAWYRGREDHRGLRALLSFVVVFVAVWSSMVAATLWGIAPILSQQVFHKPELMPVLRIAAWGIPLNALFNVFVSSLHGCGLTKQRVYLEQVISPLCRLIFIGGLFMMARSVEAAVGAVVIAYGLSAGLAGLRLAQENSFWKAPLIDLSDLGAWAKYTFPTFLDALLVTSLGGTLEIILLGMLSTKEVVGIYSIVLRLKFIINMPMAAFNTSLAPLISEAHAKRDRVRLRRLFSSTTRWVMLLGLPLVTIMIIFGQLILSLFGKPFTGGYLALVFIAVGQLVNVCAGPVGHMLLMTGYSYVRLLNSLILLTEQLGLGLLLIPSWQIVGAGLVSAASISTISIIGLIEVLFFLKMHPYRLDLIKPLMACSLAGGGIAIIRTLAGTSLWFQGMLLLGFVVAYAGLLAGLGLNGEDKTLVFQTTRRLAGKWGKSYGVN